MAIVKTKSGTWQADISFIESGERKRVRKRFRLKADAENWLVEQKTLRAQGIKKSVTTLIWIFDNFYTIYKEPFIRPNTKASWTLTRKAFINYFGKNEPINKITPDKYQQFITSYGKNHARSTVRSINQKLTEVFNYAVREKYIPSSPSIGTRVMGKDKREVTYLNVEQIKKLIKYILNSKFTRRITGTKPTGAPYIVLAAILTGARLSELSGLRWEDIDDESNIIHITHQVNLRNGSTDPYKAELVDLKTKSAKREITVPKALISKLKEIKEPGDIFVFNSMKNTLIQATTAGHELKKLLADCEIDAPNFHFHSLRHSHVALLLNEGVDIYAISKRLGHARFQITLDTYAYLIDEKKQKDNDRILKALNDLM